MKQKYLMISGIILIIVSIFISGCIQQEKSQQEKSTFGSDIQQQKSTKTEQPIKIPESPTKLETSGAPAPPADQALAEVTIISQNNDEWLISVDKIRDYIRYPIAKNPVLKEGEEISVYVNGFIDTFESRGPECPPGYIKSPKPARAQCDYNNPSKRYVAKSVSQCAVIKYACRSNEKYFNDDCGCGCEITTSDSSTLATPKIVVSEKYLSKLLGCFAELNCERLGWSGYLYNPNSIIIEHECVIPDSTIPP